jgi:hypothetical protein
MVKPKFVLDFENDKSQLIMKKNIEAYVSRRRSAVLGF